MLATDTYTSCASGGLIITICSKGFAVTIIVAIPNSTEITIAMIVGVSSKFFWNGEFAIFEFLLACQWELFTSISANVVCVFWMMGILSNRGI